jgi:hypothetical protein
VNGQPIRRVEEITPSVEDQAPGHCARGRRRERDRDDRRRASSAPMSIQDRSRRRTRHLDLMIRLEYKLQ